MKLNPPCFIFWIIILKGILPCHYWMELRFLDKNEANYENYIANGTQNNDENSKVKASETEQPFNGKYEGDNNSQIFEDEDES